MESERSPSIQSKESEVDINLPPEADPQQEDNSEEDDACALTEDESFMILTEEDQRSWEGIIKDLEDKMKEHGDKFSNWSDKITRRRMYAYSRIKKLEKISTLRKDFYCDMNNFIHSFHGDILKAHEDKVRIIKTESSEIQTVQEYNQINNDGVPDDDELQKVQNTPVITEVPKHVTGS